MTAKPQPVTAVTTEFVRRHYSMAPTAYRTDGSVAQMPSVEDVAYCERQFDEWLARHDAEVRAAALSTPPADDVREELYSMLRWGVEDDEMGLVDRILARFEVRPRGTATDAEVLRAKAAALTEFADAVRMPFTVFRGDTEEPVTPGDLMRETAARYLAEAAQARS